MKKFMTILALSLLSTAAAQNIKIGETFTSEGWTTMKLLGCVREAPTTVRCDFSHITPSDQSMTYDADRYRLISSDGREYVAQRFRAGVDGAWDDRAQLTARAGITYPYSVRFEGVPANLASALYLDVRGYDKPGSYTATTWRMSNVSLRGTAPAPAPTPAPVATPASASLNYTAVLTNCQPGAGGTLSCTALLTPRR